MDMTWYQILCLVGVPTLMTLVVTAIWNKCVNGTKKVQERRREEHQEDIRQVVHAESGSWAGDIQEIKTSIKLIGNGTQAGLRNDIMACYNGCAAKGFKTQDEAENFNDMYNAYHALGGNSFIDSDITPAFKKLPLKPNGYKKTRQKLNEGK